MNPKSVEKAKLLLENAIQCLEKSNNLIGSNQGIKDLRSALNYMNDPKGNAPSVNGFANHICDSWNLKENTCEIVLEAIHAYNNAIK